MYIIKTIYNNLIYEFIKKTFYNVNIINKKNSYIIFTVADKTSVGIFLLAARLNILVLLISNFGQTHIHFFAKSNVDV